MRTAGSNFGDNGAGGAAVASARPTGGGGASVMSARPGASSLMTAGGRQKGGLMSSRMVRSCLLPTSYSEIRNPLESIRASTIDFARVELFYSSCSTWCRWILAPELLTIVCFSLRVHRVLRSALRL